MYSSHCAGTKERRSKVEENEQEVRVRRSDLIQHFFMHAEIERSLDVAWLSSIDILPICQDDLHLKMEVKCV